MTVYGCTDGGCVFGHPGGMHTNGGCNIGAAADQKTRCRECHHKWSEHCADRLTTGGPVGCLVGWEDIRADECSCEATPPFGCTHAPDHCCQPTVPS